MWKERNKQKEAELAHLKLFIECKQSHQTSTGQICIGDMIQIDPLKGQLYIHLGAVHFWFDGVVKHLVLKCFFENFRHFNDKLQWYKPEPKIVLDYSDIRQVLASVASVACVTDNFAISK